MKDTMKIENFKFYNLRKLAAAMKEVDTEDVLAIKEAYERMGGLVEEIPSAATKKVVKKTAKKAAKKVTKKVAKKVAKKTTKK